MIHYLPIGQIIETDKVLEDSDVYDRYHFER